MDPGAKQGAKPLECDDTERATTRQDRRMMLHLETPRDALGLPTD